MKNISNVANAIDRDIPESIWNGYLRKYVGKYRTFIQDKTDIRQIKCKHGSIQLYSMKKKQLCFVGDYPSSMSKTWGIKKLPSYCKITQEGEWDFVAMFPESKLKDMENYIKIYKKKKLSEEQLKILRERMAGINEQHSKNATIGDTSDKPPC